ncbi:terpenoid cyclases/protein prenyltransferase alpha-alpha toroid [Xylaria flabelliformis]|nr:terpenoid cyclases/protein prenyltransferase alpha-alpha toroid [Xylaria flabelliformis]
MASSSPSQEPHQAPLVPDLFTTQPPIKDSLVTDTSVRQNTVENNCRTFLAGTRESIPVNRHGVPSLGRERHIKFLEKNLGNLPSMFQAADASRPWIFYWCLNGLVLLGADVSKYRDGLVETARSIQNESGGFGGGFGQQSHLATTYAMVLALAIVGGESAYQVIDRRAMWKWLCTLREPDGGFRRSCFFPTNRLPSDHELRGAYCAAVLVTILKLPLDLPSDSPSYTPEQPNLFTGLADYVRRCQTFEGGISARPGAEAHGAYAFCALGCLAVLDAPHRIFPRFVCTILILRPLRQPALLTSHFILTFETRCLDMPRLISWLSSRQYAPEGGLSGRTNKLVDGCYSHWVGGCWPLIAAAIHGPVIAASIESPSFNVDDLYSREGLIRYILCCGQDQTKRGGMRDKPFQPSDAYHTCYVLNGLSTAQHITRILTSDEDGMMAPWTYEVLPHLDEKQVYNEEDRVSPTDPVYVIPEGKRKDIMSYFSSQPGF